MIFIRHGSSTVGRAVSAVSRSPSGFFISAAPAARRNRINHRNREPGDIVKVRLDYGGRASGPPPVVSHASEESLKPTTGTTLPVAASTACNWRMTAPFLSWIRSIY